MIVALTLILTAAFASPLIARVMGGSSPVLGAVTGETAVAAGKTQTREGARYRRLARRRGKAKALVALGNTQMRGDPFRQFARMSCPNWDLVLGDPSRMCFGSSPATSCR